MIFLLQIFYSLQRPNFELLTFLFFDEIPAWIISQAHDPLGGV